MTLTISSSEVSQIKDNLKKAQYVIEQAIELIEKFDQATDELESSLAKKIVEEHSE
jgi:hypothetical protein